MLKKKVIATSISNLTDARYFAGWMVDMVVFNIDPNHKNFVDPQELGVLQSWIEGPNFFLEMNENQLVDAEKWLVQLNCQGIFLPWSHRAKIANLDVPVLFRLSLKEWYSDYEKLANEKVVLYGAESFNELENGLKGSSAKELFIEFNGLELSESQLLNPAIDGYLVHGSPEEKVGYKSFDEMDDFFEIIQDF